MWPYSASSPLYTRAASNTASWTTDRCTALGLRWTGADQVALAAHTDCPDTGPPPHGDACYLFAGHPGRHTWQDDPPAEPPTHL
ncbi:hypothetical protein ACRWOO_14965 [Streptomyces sp. NEAU-PBA10]|uniref:hypothetical protein n=1 Tax=Streptomyces sp. NEAU-PBA10 TaxID=3438640 RepID=UPI003F790E72